MNLFACFGLEQTPETSFLNSVRKNKFQEDECEHCLMTINEIINGSVRYFSDINSIRVFLF